MHIFCESSLPANVLHKCNCVILCQLESGSPEFHTTGNRQLPWQIGRRNCAKLAFIPGATDWRPSAFTVGIPLRMKTYKSFRTFSKVEGKPISCQPSSPSFLIRNQNPSSRRVSTIFLATPTLATRLSAP